jgi:outer membrane protein
VIPKPGLPGDSFLLLGWKKERRFLRRHITARTCRTGISKEFFIHMKRSLALIVLLASGLISSLTLSAHAQTPAAPAAPAGPAKIAVIAFQVAVAQTNEGQRNFADLQKKYDPKRQQLKVLSDDVESMKKQLQAQGDKLSDAERASRAKVIDDKEKKLQRDVEDAQNDFQTEMQELYNGLASKVYDVLATYAQQQGFTVVLDVSAQQQAPVVLYANDSTNITKAVVDAYNVKSGVPAPPPAQPAAAAPKAPAAH